MSSKKVLVVFGTRPEAIKMAPLVKELETTSGLTPVVCVTAQHREMLDQVLRFFDIKTQMDLNIMKEGQSLYSLSADLLKGMEKVFQSDRYDLVLVHGDTTTACIGALAAYYAKVPVGHVEAGLRTYDKYAPFPEEMNREWIGRVADMHFAPTPLSAAHLKAENRSAHIYVTGNTGIDAMKWTLKAPFRHPIQTKLRKDSRLILMTMHRRENWGEPMKGVFEAVKCVIRKHPEVEVIYPVHPNPVLKEAVAQELEGHERIHLTGPLDVVDLHHIMQRAYLVLTDSGGIQEEAPSLGKPVLVLRDKTERPEGVTAGTLKCVGTERDSVQSGIEELLTDQEAYRSMAKAQNPFGDGTASRRIVSAIQQFFQSQRG
ncbi:UDP-N-acetylglucosamine 2-epimerase (non-hydrolyzing) [Paenibacillus lautus]|uniref:UDP-N-acetylglucosamine 2-epimerase (non-hydrolyzing) n=1 Tax=Paenibacillus lautus TaxID=1401 RepID=A0A385TKB4_PAELA|nr:UDP-N-acetylglucosamine 2-epimerase (non-hydrolyzing) [Paenibacillus lautus]AYB43428.1 UDP-N-acetylglucosamine 2-epimerase (non-hydrolyzing) [Paenibacillus lautus]MBY0160092.1 UDP-N-acetylglucosamine 2-epimerase (non-hydrolyzing) [Cytobacillus firmus]VTR38956.1 UDP-N-acetyl glucosamine-2-epimerase [Actinobacillus pleuropneumoniae]